MPNIKIVKNPAAPEPAEVLAEAVIRIGAAMKKLSDSGLNEKAIVVLIQDACGLPKRDIKLVLDSLKRLQGWYCR